MATEVTLPRLGQGMEAGTITKWLKAEGDPVAKGDLLYEVDTDKTTQEVEAEAAGVLLRIAVPSGEVPVGATLAWVGEAGETVPDAAVLAAPEAADPGLAASAEAPAPGPAQEPAREQGRAAAAEAAEAAAPAPSAGADDRIKASPLARRMARERGLELAALTGTGPDGRIVADDVERAGAAPAPAVPVPAGAPAVPAGEVERIALSATRRTIARRLTAAWEVPAFQLTLSAETTAAEALLARRRELDPDLRVTFTDVLVKVCAAALIRHREVNAQYADDAILRFPTANVALAVAAPNGLVVPVIRSAERLTLAEVAAARAALVDRARAGKLTPDDMADGTFTISNLGMFGIEQFTAVLNPPQAAILAVGTSEPRPVARDGEVVVRPMTTLTATFDHRTVDGAPAAAFLETVKALLEQPGLAL